MHTHFNFLKKEQFYIYGYTALGRKIALFLRRNGYQVVGFIDRNASTLRKRNEDEIFWLENNKIDTDCVIIISLQDIAAQHQVAEYLNGKGYAKLIFMVAGRNYPVEYAKVIRDAWERLSCEELPNGLLLPTYEKSTHTRDELWLQDRGESVVIWIPVELIHLKATEDFMRDFQERGILNERNLCRLKSEKDEPIVCNESLTALFDFLLGNRGCSVDFFKDLAFFAGRDVNQYIQRRVSVLQVWDDELERGVGYFIDAAASVKWNPKGYFNIIDGTHRSMYLFYRGFTKVPALMRKEDYQRYFHADAAKYFSTVTGRFALPHPLFYRELFSKKGRSRLHIALLRYLKRIGWKKDGFLDLEGRDGYLAVSMKHFGAKKVGCLVRDYCMRDMEKGAELVYVKDIHFFEAGMWKQLDPMEYSAVYIKDTMDAIPFERSAFRHGIVFYDKIQGGEASPGEIIYSYFDECGDARDVVAINGG